MIYPWVEKIPWRTKWQITPIFLPGKSHGPRSLRGYSPWGCKRVGHSANEGRCLHHPALFPVLHWISVLPTERYSWEQKWESSVGYYLVITNVISCHLFKGLLGTSLLIYFCQSSKFFLCWIKSKQIDSSRISKNQGLPPGDILGLWLWDKAGSRCGILMGCSQEF